MPENPFARDPAVTVGVGADTQGFNSAIDGAIAKMGSFKTAVAGAGLALGALATGALAKAVSTAADFEQAMVEVEKVTSAAVAEKMAGSIRELSETIPLAQSELATIAADAGRFGIEGPEAISAFTESVAKMAEATDLGASQAGEALAKLATLTDTPVSKIENLGSVINKLSNNFATSSQEIVDSMLRSSAALVQLGLNQHEIAGLSASLNEVSESSERAGTRLRRVAQELMDPGRTDALAQAMGLTVDSFRRMREESPVQLIREMARRLAEGGKEADALRSELTVVSQQALGALGQNLDGVTQAQRLANKEFDEATSLQREFEAATDTFNAKLQLFRNRLGNVAIQIGNVLLPPLTKLLTALSDGVAAFSDWNQRLGGIPATLGLVGTAIAGFGLAVSTLISVLGGASAIIGTVGAALTLLTGPIGIAIAAIGALALAYKENLFGIRTVVDNTLARIKSIWNLHFAAIARETREAMASIQQAIKPALEFLQGVWRRHGDTITRIVKGAFQLIGTIITTSLDALLTGFRVTLNLLQGDWKGAWRAVSGFFRRSLDRMEQLLENWGLLSKVRGIVSDVEGIWRGAWLSNETLVSRTISRIANWISGSGANLIGRAIGHVISAIKRPFKALYNWIIGGSFIPNLFFDVAGWLRSRGKSTLGNAFGTVVSKIQNVVNRIDLRAMRNEVQNTVRGIGQWVRNRGKSILGNAFGAVVSKVQNVLGGIDLSGIKRAIRNVIGKANRAKREVQEASRSLRESERRRFDHRRNTQDDDDDDGRRDQSTRSSRGRTGATPMQSGGFVERAGLALVHAGEQVLPPAKVDRTAAPGGSKTVIHIEKIEASGRREGELAGRELKRELRSAGFR